MGAGQAGHLANQRFRIGASAYYVSVEEMARQLGVQPQDVEKLCSTFPEPIPLISLPGQDYHSVLLYAFESALFSLGLPASQREDPALASAHQELAGLLYGGLTKQALCDRVELLAKTLTSACNKTKMKRKRASWKRDAGQWPTSPASISYEPLDKNRPPPSS